MIAFHSCKNLAKIFLNFFWARLYLFSLFGLQKYQAITWAADSGVAVGVATGAATGASASGSGAAAFGTGASVSFGAAASVVLAFEALVSSESSTSSPLRASLASFSSSLISLACSLASSSLATVSAQSTIYHFQNLLEAENSSVSTSDPEPIVELLESWRTLLVCMLNQF